MALSIKTDEADRLARALAKLTGESLTDAVTTALRERLAREQIKRSSGDAFAARVHALTQRLRADYDTRPVGKAEWDAASGDEP
jgi:antitoxin VapB